MRFDRGIVLSVAGHGAFFLWALVSFARPMETKQVDIISADVISADDYSRLTAGTDKAPKKEVPKPLVEKVAEAKPVKDLNAKVVENKKEVVATTDETNPEPKPKLPDPKPAAAPDKPKEEAKAAEKKEPEQKIDPIADALKKDEAKKPEKKAESKPQPVKKPEPQQPKFDPRKVAMLLDKRDSQRTAAAGATINSTVSQGAPTGDAQALSVSEISALAARLKQNWNTPPGAGNMKVRIFISLKRDGTLAAPPEVMTEGSGGIYQAMRDSAIRAINASQPFNMLRPSTYDVVGGWKELDLRFNTDDFM
jgi:colicin import membrane protein